MPINRAPWNALVDDDGSNLVGTVWNKDKIKTVLLDPIDALPIGATWQAVPFSAANFSAVAPMTWTVGSGAITRNIYTVVGKILFWSFYVSWFSGGNVLGGSPSSVITMTVPGGLSVIGGQQGLVNFCAGVTGVPGLAGLGVESANNTIRISKGVGGNFALADVPGMITTIIMEIA